MDGLGGWKKKWKKSDRKQTMYDITFLWNLKNATSECKKKKKQIYRYRKQTSGYQWGERSVEGNIDVWN